MFLNRVILIGRIVTDIDDALKYTPSGIPVIQFRLAVDRPQSNENRQNGVPKQTDFITIVAWRQNAEFTANYLSKGRLVAIEGQLQMREFEHQGQKRREAEVIVDNLKSLERPKEGEEGAQGGSGGSSRASGGGYSNGGGGRRDDYADADPGGDTGYGDEAPASPPPARAPARPAAAPARPAANNNAPRPAAGGGRYQPPADEDMDDPFADN